MEDAGAPENEKDEDEVGMEEHSNHFEAEEIEIEMVKQGSDDAE